MEKFSMDVQMRWADLDPNFHTLHSVYYDWGATCRMKFLTDQGLTIALMKKLNFGPIIFREECVFRKEVAYGDVVSINLTITKAKKNYSRWSLHHEIIKNGDVTAAIINIDGAWLNTIERKLFTPPPEVAVVFDQIPRSPQFVWLD